MSGFKHVPDQLSCHHLPQFLSVVETATLHKGPCSIRPVAP